MAVTSFMNIGAPHTLYYRVNNNIQHVHTPRSPYKYPHTKVSYC